MPPKPKKQEPALEEEEEEELEGKTIHVLRSPFVRLSLVESIFFHLQVFFFHPICVSS
jgi:hypothetical protein